MSGLDIKSQRNKIFPLTEKRVKKLFRQQNSGIAFKSSYEKDSQNICPPSESAICILNHVERICAAIEYREIDDKMVFNTIGPQVISYYEKLFPIIHYARNRTDPPDNAYFEFLERFYKRHSNSKTNKSY